MAKSNAKSKSVVKKAKNGRPTKYNAEEVTLFKAAFANSFTVDQACIYAGVSKQTFYTWLDVYPDFLDQMTRAREQPTMKAKQVVVGSINKGDVESAKWWLKNKASDEFGGTPTQAGQTINNFIVMAQEDVNAFTTPNTI